MKGFVLSLLLLVACASSAMGQYHGGYVAPCSTPNCAPSYSTANHFVSYSGWWYACYPKDHNFYYKIRYAYDSYGNKTLQHDSCLYCRYWNGCAWAYKHHSYIPVETAVAHAYTYPVERVVYREVPVLTAPISVGTTQYGGFVSAKGQLYQEPVTDLQGLLNAKRGQDDLALARELSIAAKQMSDGAVKISLNSQEVQKLKNAGDAEVARIIAQGAVAENVAVKALQQASGLGSQNLIGSDGTVTAQGADALSVIINNKCFKCHGGEEVKGGIDFNLVDEFTDEQRLSVYGAVASGEMPKDDKLNKSQISLFKAWVLGKTPKAEKE